MIKISGYSDAQKEDIKKILLKEFKKLDRQNDLSRWIHIEDDSFLINDIYPYIEAYVEENRIVFAHGAMFTDPFRTIKNKYPELTIEGGIMIGNDNNRNDYYISSPSMSTNMVEDYGVLMRNYNPETGNYVDTWVPLRETTWEYYIFSHDCGVDFECMKTPETFMNYLKRKYQYIIEKSCDIDDLWEISELIDESNTEIEEIFGPRGEQELQAIHHYIDRIRSDGLDKDFASSENYREIWVWAQKLYRMINQEILGDRINYIRQVILIETNNKGKYRGRSDYSIIDCKDQKIYKYRIEPGVDDKINEKTIYLTRYIADKFRAQVQRFLRNAMIQTDSVGKDVVIKIVYTDYHSEIFTRDLVYNDMTLRNMILEFSKKRKI